jgi:(1->4)-alpha-D-glucan 1-alpha-D-glucosylmutase
MTIGDLYADDDVMGAFADWFDITSEAARAIDPVSQGRAADLPWARPTVISPVRPSRTTWSTRTIGIRRLRRAGQDGTRTRRSTTGQPGRRNTTSPAPSCGWRRRRPAVFVGPLASYRPLPSSSGHVTSLLAWGQAMRSW